ncbi:MAG: flavodoxin family protein [Spirochaetaceae bacterium]|nr:MAG: flavodoxin family protein [Spirochaetaceae bacterium]
MKVVGITGSPRKESNTAYYVQLTLDRLRNHGIETELVTLYDKQIHYCTGCYGCVKAKRCTLAKDDFEEVFSKMCDADGLLIGSPVYNGSSTALIKALLDRAGFLGRWINNDMKPAGDQYEWKGTAFSGKVAAPVTVARRAGQNFTFAELLLWMTVNDFTVIGSHYWNVGVAGKGGALDAENDSEAISILEHLGDNMAHVLKKLHA